MDPAITSFNNDCNQAGGRKRMMHYFLFKRQFIRTCEVSNVFYRFYCLDFDFTAKITCFMTTMIDENSGAFTKANNPRKEVQPCFLEFLEGVTFVLSSSSSQ